MTPYDNSARIGADNSNDVPPTGGYVTIRRLDELAEAKAYLDRIGARATGPWSAAIHTERDGYEFDRSSVRLKYEVHGKTVSIVEVGYSGDEPDLAPTEVERAAILDAAKHVRWPRPFLRYGLGHDLPEDMAEALRTGNIYIFYDGERDPRTCYVQTYHPGVTGRGKYRSWLHIDTQEWISGQPNDLPLYGLDQVPSLAESIKCVFIHEGPKAAEMVKRYLDPDREDNRLDHPWAEFLATGIHIGWPGGGNRYRRVDWSPLQALAKLKGLPVVVVADNDKVGVSAAKAIAEEYIPGSESRDVRWLKWPDGMSLKGGFDLADPWPAGRVLPLEGMLRRRRYVGRSRATEWTPEADAVAERLKEQGLVFNFGGLVAQVAVGESGLRTVVSKAENLQKPVEEVSLWKYTRAPRNGGDREEIPEDVPEKILKLLLANPEGFNELQGVIDHPITVNGELVYGHSGYNPATKLYVSTKNIDIEKWDSPRRAAEWLIGVWLKPFPLKDRNDAVRALMLACTLLTRRFDVSGGAPIFLFSAPQANTGKSFLARNLHAAITGSVPGPTLFKTNQEEMSKLLTSALMQSPPAIFFDNLKNGSTLENRVLDLYATTETWVDRFLGETREVTLPTRSVLMFTGNSITVASDTKSRTVRVRLEGQFNSDGHGNWLDFTRENRGKILGALVSLMSAEVPGPMTGARFEEWNKKVAWPVMMACDAPHALDDLFEATREAREDHPALAELLAAIWLRQQKSENGKLRAGDIVADDKCQKFLRELLHKKEGDPDIRVNNFHNHWEKLDVPVAGLRLKYNEEAAERKNKKSGGARQTKLYWVEAEEGCEPDEFDLPM